MPLPTYNKNNRRKSFEALPKGAYVLKILDAKIEKNKNNNGEHIKVSFDIAEGDHKDFYANQYKASTKGDKQWPFDAVYRVNIPDNDSPAYVWTNYNSFFADLEDSNNGFVFSGDDLKILKGKLIGGKFRNEQSEYKGTVYDHTRLAWTCVAEDVRQGKAGKMPNDKLVKGRATAPATDSDGFMSIAEDVDMELPFV